MRSWIFKCPNCRVKFIQVVDYAEHMHKCPIKCSFCKLWFDDLNAWVSHRCKRLEHDH